tara:strand:- start:68 stop:673 length:606 start_codon:yes stop_codon:yes gene_type:complete
MEKMGKQQFSNEEILNAFNELVKDGKVKDMNLEKRLNLVKKFQFKDVKTIEKLVSELDKITDKLEKEYGQIEMLFNDYDKTEDLVKNQREILDRADNGIDLANNQLKEAKKSFEKQEKTFNKIFEKNQKSEDKLLARNGKYKDAYKKGEKLANNIKSAMKQVEAAAKSLGITGEIDAIDLGKISINFFDGQISDAAKDVGY